MLKLPFVFLGAVIIIILVVLILFIANHQFNQKVKAEVQIFFDNQDQARTEIVKERDLQGLPLSVQRWLKYTGVIGKERITTARSKQTMTLRMKKDQQWMTGEAEQYFMVSEPGFIWKAKIKAAPFVHIMGRDKYFEGKGNMLIKLLSLFTVADGKGKEIDQGSLVRFLAETVWTPTVALSEYIKWEEIDASSAKATMSYKGVTASGVFTFNEQGEVISFEAPRYGDFGGKYVLETWSISVKKYKELDGIKIPTQGEVTWKLKSGDFTWYKFQVEEIEYNKPVIY